MSDDHESPAPATTHSRADSTAPVTSNSHPNASAPSLPDHQPNSNHGIDLDLELTTFLKPLSLSLDTLHALAYHFSQTYTSLAQTSEEQFLPTPVTKLPTGQETGRYLAIDVGGTNLRVGFIELLGDNDTSNSHLNSMTNSEESSNAEDGPGNGTANERSRDALQRAQRPRIRRTLEKAWPIGEHLKKDQADDLFAWIGDCIAEVVSDSLKNESTKLGDVPEELDLGITFSFPMMQDTLDAATLMPMGKGFAITSDLNLGSMLLAGYKRHTNRQNGTAEPTAKRRKLFSLPSLKIAAITNDTVATLASLAYQVKSLPNSRVAMGIIVGTGCNATIPMKLTDLGRAKAESIVKQTPKATETVVNTEWTIGGAAPPLHELGITTEWDKALDAATARPGFQPFEYMTGGRYIGELVRLIVFDFFTSVIKTPAKHLPPLIAKVQGLPTYYLSQVVARAKSDPILASTLSSDHPTPDGSPWIWTPENAKVLRKIAFVVQTRSAGLTAAATVGLLACAKEITLTPLPSISSTESRPSTAATMTDDTHNRPLTPNSMVLSEGVSPAGTPIPHPPTTAPTMNNGTTMATLTLSQSTFTQTHPSWHSGPEELVVAYTGGIIQHYPHFKDTCQRYIDRLVMRTGPQDSGKSVFLREASDGGIIGAGVLAGTVKSSVDADVTV